MRPRVTTAGESSDHPRRNFGLRNGNACLYYKRPREAFRISLLVKPNGDDYPDAATKHIEDATALWKAGRPDGAGYHAGYVLECASKSVIRYGTGNNPGGHNVSALSAQALRLAALAGSRTARYAMPPYVTYRALDAGWNVEMRYWSPVRMPNAQALTWLRGAWRVYNATVGRMKKDGVV
jgi:hypothetical protein